jgi:hypothetical protein
MVPLCQAIVIATEFARGKNARLIQLRVQTINIEFRLTGVPIRFVKFAPLRKLRSSEACQPPIYYLFESESVSIVFAKNSLSFFKSPSKAAALPLAWRFGRGGILGDQPALNGELFAFGWRRF